MTNDTYRDQATSPLAATIRALFDPFQATPRLRDLIDLEKNERGNCSFDDMVEAKRSSTSLASYPTLLHGLRNELHSGHVSEQRMVRAGCDANMLTGERSKLGSAVPGSLDEIRHATVCRWRPLTARGCDPMKMYAGDALYDADWSSDELMLQSVFVSLGEFVAMLGWLFLIDRWLFQAIWVRDINGIVGAMSKNAATIETMTVIDPKRAARFGVHFKREARKMLPEDHPVLQLGDVAAGVLVIVCIFFEFERGFEHLDHVTGPDPITEVMLAQALATKAAMIAEINRETTLGNYLAGCMLHRLPLAQGMATLGKGHVPESPHVSCAPGGNPLILDMVVGSQSDESYAAICREHGVLAPFGTGTKAGIIKGSVVTPAIFVHGMEPLRLAFALLLMIAQRLPEMRGPHAPGPRQGTHHEVAYGRLSMMIMSHFDEKGAQEMLERSLSASSTARIQSWPPSLDGLVCNNNTWTRSDPLMPPQRVLSESFGDGLYVSNVRATRSDLNKRIPDKIDRPGAAHGFYPDAWIYQDAYGSMLAQTTRASPNAISAAVRKSLPGFYPSLDRASMDVLSWLANQINQAITPMAEDPANRLPQMNLALSGSLATAGCSIMCSTSSIVKAVIDGALAGTPAVLKSILPGQITKAERLRNASIRRNRRFAHLRHDRTIYPRGTSRVH
jgi:hypothetical protein